MPLQLLEQWGCSACPREVQVCRALINVLSDQLFVLDGCSCIIDLLMASQLKFCHSHTFLLQKSGRKDSYWEETVIKKQICLCEMSQHRQKLRKRRMQNFNMVKSFSRNGNSLLGARGRHSDNYHPPFSFKLYKQLGLKTPLSVSKLSCFMLEVDTSVTIGDVYGIV